TNDFQALGMILLVQLHQERRFVLAIRTPTPANRQEHHLVPKSRIGTGNNFSVQAGKDESERNAWVLYAGITGRVRRFRNALRSGLALARRHVIGAAVQRDRQSPVWIQLGLKQQRTLSCKMTEDEPPILPVANEESCVSVN